MIRRAMTGFTPGRWFIRVILYAELAVLTPFITLIVATSV
jgi:hypothetical protein